jgi:hypothetical protein
MDQWSGLWRSLPASARRVLDNGLRNQAKRFPPTPQGQPMLKTPKRRQQTIETHFSPLG